MEKGKARINKINNCYQCRYGNEESERFYSWCHEASREVEDLAIIPSWCPLPLFKDSMILEVDLPEDEVKG